MDYSEQQEKEGRSFILVKLFPEFSYSEREFSTKLFGPFSSLQTAANPSH